MNLYSYFAFRHFVRVRDDLILPRPRRLEDSRLFGEYSEGSLKYQKEKHSLSSNHCYTLVSKSSNYFNPFNFQRFFINCCVTCSGTQCIVLYDSYTQKQLYAKYLRYLNGFKCIFYFDRNWLELVHKSDNIIIIDNPAFFFVHVMPVIVNSWYCNISNYNCTDFLT